MAPLPNIVLDDVPSGGKENNEEMKKHRIHNKNSRRPHDNENVTV